MTAGLQRMERLALPAVPLTGRGAARTQPLWADDLERTASSRRSGAAPTAMRATSWRGRVLLLTGRSSSSSCTRPVDAGPPVPIPLVALRASLKAGELLAGPTTLRPGTRR